MGQDGTIYMGCRDGYLYAINPDGTLKWKFAGRGPMHIPAIGEDSTVYIGDENGGLYTVNPDGTIKWAYVTAGVRSDYRNTGRYEEYPPVQ